MKTTHLYHLGKNIRQLREYRGLSQQALADASGVERSKITKIENGNWNPTINTLAKLATALQCAIDITFSPIK